MDDVERLFHKLVDVLANYHPDRLSQPLEASEIYRRFIPYRRFRSVLKFDTNQDYEMAVLSFLAGKHGFASVEPPEARDELVAEAESINPNPSFIREHAAVRVYLNSNEVAKYLDRREPYAPPDEEEPEERDDEGVTDSADANEVAKYLDRREPYAPPNEEEPERSEKVDDHDDEGVTDSAHAEEPELDQFERWVWGGTRDEELVDDGPAEDSQDEPAGEKTESAFVLSSEVRLDVSLSVTEEDETRAACIHCEKDLPLNREVKFCPFCGGDQTKRECKACGEELELGWKFCIGCGETFQD